MKRYISILLVGLLFACGGQKTNESTEDESTSTEREVKTDARIGQNTCKAFLNDFEEWSGEFTKVAKQIVNNPGDQSNLQDYMELAGEMMKWSSKWEEIGECADDPKYRKRFEELSDKLNEDLEAIKK